MTNLSKKTAARFSQNINKGKSIAETSSLSDFPDVSKFN